MSNISVDWRHITVAAAVLFTIGGYLIFRPAPPATFSESIPAGQGAIVELDAPHSTSPAALPAQ